MDQAKDYVFSNLGGVPAQWLQVLGLLQVDVHQHPVLRVHRPSCAGYGQVWRQVRHALDRAEVSEEGTNMLYLRTGLPGAGKTLNAIREIDIEHQPDPDDPTKRLHGPGQSGPAAQDDLLLRHPGYEADRLKSKWVEFDTPEEWYNLPDGSVIVIDEAQRVFGNDGSRARPEKVTRFETHRHQGLDIHLITQHPSLLCASAQACRQAHQLHSALWSGERHLPA